MRIIVPIFLKQINEDYSPQFLERKEFNMKKLDINKQTKLIAIKNSKSDINYYILTPDNERLYAFTRPYSQKSWDMCKSGIRVNDLITTRTKNTGIMLLVKYTKYIMPYLCEEYGLATA